MIKKLIVLLCFCGVATYSPAPIIDKSLTPHALKNMTPQDLAAAQRFNGTVGVVGSVPSVANESGSVAPAIPKSATASMNLAASNPEMQEKAKRNLTTAQRELSLSHSGGVSPVLVLLVVVAAVGGGMFGVKSYLDKNGPAPATFNPSERLRKNS